MLPIKDIFEEQLFPKDLTGLFYDPMSCCSQRTKSRTKQSIINYRALLLFYCRKNLSVSMDFIDNKFARMLALVLKFLSMSIT